MKFNEEQELIISEQEQETQISTFEVTGVFEGGTETSLTMCEEQEDEFSEEHPDWAEGVTYFETTVRQAFEAMAEGTLIEDSFTLTSVMGISKEEFLAAE